MFGAIGRVLAMLSAPAFIPAAQYLSVYCWFSTILHCSPPHWNSSIVMLPNYYEIALIHPVMAPNHFVLFPIHFVMAFYRLLNFMLPSYPLPEILKSFPVETIVAVTLQKFLNFHT